MDEDQRAAGALSDKVRAKDCLSNARRGNEYAGVVSQDACKNQVR